MVSGGISIADAVVGRRQRIVARTTMLDAAPAQAFEAVNSPVVARLIDPAVRSWTPDTDPIDVGTRFDIRARLGIVPIRGTSEALVWDPPNRVLYRSVKPTWPFRMVAEHRFEPAGPHAAATSYTWTIVFREMNIIARPIIAIAARLFATAMRNQADALTRYLRQTGSGSTR